MTARVEKALGEMIKLFPYDAPTRKFNSRYGVTSWAVYLEKEKERIEKTPGRVVEIRRNYRRPIEVTLFVNRIAYDS
jgi:hypothetical protein